MCIEVDAPYENQKPPYAREAAERMDDSFNAYSMEPPVRIGSAVSPMTSTISQSSTR